MKPDDEKSARIFLPRMYERKDFVQKQNIRFVHYTTAEAATKIILEKAVWLRDPSCMNDFTEVRHGIDCVSHAWKSAEGAKFKTALNGIFEGASNQVEGHFNGWIPHVTNDVYVSCFSEHYSEEDVCGRLSMWRADGTSFVAFN